MSKTFGTKAVKCNTCEAWTTPSPNHAATGTTCAKCLYPDQSAADRERIAGEMNKRVPCDADEFGTLDAAVRAFEVLCEPRGWLWERKRNSLGQKYWVASNNNSVFAPSVESTGNHAADVCRLICEVLDREAKEASNGQ